MSMLHLLKRGPKTCPTRCLIIFCLTLAFIWPTATPEAREIVGTGDFYFYLDAAAFKGRDNRVLQEIYVRIPNSEVKFKEDGERFFSNLRLSILVADAEGNPVVQDSEVMVFDEDDKKRVGNSLFFQTIIKRYFIEPGVYSLSYAVEDLNAPRVTVLGAIQGKNKLSAVRKIRLDAPEIPEDQPSFSHPMYVWSVEKTLGKTVYHPNPPRLYGLYNDTLTVYLELYLPDSLALEPAFEFRSYLVNAGGEIVSDNNINLPNPSVSAPPGGADTDGPARIKTYPVVVREDLTALPAGDYSLLFSFGLGGRTLTRIRGGSFSVAWDIRTWEVARRNFHVEARFLLGDEAYAEFSSKSMGEQEQILEKMWKSLDPTPETVVNETYVKFLERLNYINDKFSGFGDAIYSDRGQIYMKWGAPDEMIQDVIPVNRETISEAVELVENRFHGMNFSTHGVKPYSLGSSNRISDPKGVGNIDEGGNVGYPYELWVYNGTGDPLLERDRIMHPDIGKRYLFIDREGYGRYTLESSSTFSAK